MGGFYGMPTRAGKLVLLNHLLWVIVAIGVATDQPVLYIPAVVACWPIAWIPFKFCDIEHDYHGFPVSPWRHIGIIVLIGVNSVPWGYGFSWLLSLSDKKPTGRRGFAVIFAPRGGSTVAPESDYLASIAPASATPLLIRPTVRKILKNIGSVSLGAGSICFVYGIVRSVGWLCMTESVRDVAPSQCAVLDRHVWAAAIGILAMLAGAVLRALDS